MEKDNQKNHLSFGYVDLYEGRYKLGNNNITLGYEAGIYKEKGNNMDLVSQVGIYRWKGESMTSGYTAEIIVISDSIETAFELIRKEAANIGLEKNFNKDPKIEKIDNKNQVLYSDNQSY